MDPEIEPLHEAAPRAIVDAQISTLDFLAGTPLPPDFPAGVGARAATLAQQAFTAIISNPSEEEQRTAVLNLRTPSAVQHHVTMLNAYDWEFVEEAKKLRGYVVATLLTESKHPEAKVRLRAIELLGKVTEVAAFTERKEITIKKEDAGAVEERLKARLKSLLPPTLEVQDAEVKEIAVVKHAVKGE